jgi:hypothetical protein
VLQQTCAGHGDHVAFQDLNTAGARSTAALLPAELCPTYARVVDSDQLLTEDVTDGRVVDRQIRERPTSRLEGLVIGPTASPLTP